MPGKNSASLEKPGLNVCQRQHVEIAHVVLRHQRHRLRPQHAARRHHFAAVQQHAQERDVVRRRGEQPAAAGIEFAIGAGGGAVSIGVQRPVRLARVHLHRARRSNPAADRSCCRACPAAAKMCCLHVGFQVLPAGRLHHAAGPVDVDAVFPALAGFEAQAARSAPPACRYARRAGPVTSREACLVRVPRVVDETRRVGQQAAQRDLLPRRPQHRLARGVEAFQHLRLPPVPAAPRRPAGPAPACLARPSASPRCR